MYNDRTIRRTKVASNPPTLPILDGGLGLLHIRTNAALSTISSFIQILSHSVDDQNSILANILHKKPTRYNTAVRFLNSHYFKSYSIVWKQTKLMPILNY